MQARDPAEPAVQNSFTDEQWFTAASDGGGRDGEPVVIPHMKKLTDDEIKKRAARIRKFKP